MNDLISRQATIDAGGQYRRYTRWNMRLIDADELIDIMIVNRYYQFVVSIDEVPTIDAVPVIRCKDCKYYRDGDCWHEWDNEGRMYYQSVINEPNPDDYCSKAERKEE